MRIRRFFHTILAVIALGIVWQMVSTWSRAMPGVQPESARARTEDRSAPALPPRSIQTGQDLAEQITDKDLFSPDRTRPVMVQPPVSGAEPPPLPSHLTLVGVLLAPGRQEAFVADASQGNRVTRVRQGEQIEMYRLTGLSAAEARLSLGGDAGEVVLPLALLGSEKAKNLPRLIPRKAPAATAATPDGQPVESTVAAVEASGGDPAEIRDQIRELQRRLRAIRRQAARERQAEQARDRAAAEAAAPAAAAPE